MAIVLTKKKPTLVKPEPDEMLSDFAELIDNVGTLGQEAEKINKQIKTLQEQLKPYNDAVAKLKAKIEEIEAGDDAEREELGASFRLEIGKRGTSREIKDLKKVQKLMGNDLFYKCAKVALKDIDAYLTLPQRGEVIKENRTTRSFKVVERA
ncbi:MAG: hypothetical protein KJZ83_00250 [Burkholderiaceae bacterium]|nr:hypothetical protein [Burkholderiaceae bacterium]